MPCSPGMTDCRRLCQHRALVEEYRAARLNAELRREDVTRGWATELADHPPILTFRDWLIQTRRDDREEHAA